MNKQTEFILKWKSGVQRKYFDFFLEFFRCLKAKRHEDDLVKIKHSSWKYKSSRCNVILKNCQTILKDIKKVILCAQTDATWKYSLWSKTKTNKQENNREKQEKTKNVRSSA